MSCYYIKVISSHWPMPLEFKSQLSFTVGECFRIAAHTGTKKYPTRFKVIEVSDKPSYQGALVEILQVETGVDPF